MNYPPKTQTGQLGSRRRLMFGCLHRGYLQSRWAEFKRHACEQKPLMWASPAEFSSPAEYRLGHGQHQTAAILLDGAELRMHDSIGRNKNPPLPCGASVKLEAPSVSPASWPPGGHPPICEVTLIATEAVFIRQGLVWQRGKLPKACTLLNSTL